MCSPPSYPRACHNDPTFAYELAVIVQGGLERMYRDNEDVFYYITVLNENYAHPPIPDGAREGILKGLYLLRPAGESASAGSVQLMGSGSILREVIAAADLLRDEFGVASNVWSATSFTELRREGLEVERWNMLHPQAAPRVSYVEQCLAPHEGPVIAASDYMKIVADQIRPTLPKRRFVSLGTDGYGRSDTREALRKFFEVDRHYIVVAALKALADEGRIAVSRVSEAIERYGIEVETPGASAL